MTGQVRSWAELSARLGRNDLPYTLAMSHLVHGTLDPADLPKAVAQAWTAAEWPEQLMESGSWLTLFEQAGFVTDYEPTPADGTTTSIILYRGATADRALGMSWTSDRDQAKWFAQRFVGLRDTTETHVYQITATEPELLAHFTSRHENEWVVDTSDFQMTDLTVLHTYSERTTR